MSQRYTFSLQLAAESPDDINFTSSAQLRVTFTAEDFADAKAQLAAKFTTDDTTAETW